MTSARPAMDEVLALDLKVLRSPDGSPLDAASHRVALDRSLARAEWALVRRGGRLVGYGYLWPLDGATWFVGGLALDPECRTAPTIAALGGAMAALIVRIGAERLESHVLRTNVASLRLHRRLGFEVTRESERAIAFGAEVGPLLARLPV